MLSNNLRLQYVLLLSSIIFAAFLSLSRTRPIRPNSTPCLALLQADGPVNDMTA